MKLKLNNFLSTHSSEISQAKANHFEALLIPINDYDVYPFNNIDDKDFIYEIADDYGWDKFVIIDFLNNKTEVIDITVDAA